MKATILLNNNYREAKQVEEEEKSRYLRGILELMGVPISEIWPSENLLNVEQRIKLRSILATYAVQVIDDLDGHMQIYVEGDKVAEWFKCSYKLKRDLREIDPRKRFYLEMEVSTWSLFEEEAEQEK
jgi:hypothetical protein